MSGIWSIRVRMPSPACSWCRAATLARPDVTIRVESCFRLPSGEVVEIAELAGRGWREALAAATKDPASGKIDVVAEGTTSATIRARSPSCALVEAASALGLPPHLPFQVKEGADEWTLLATKEEAQSLLERLHAAGIEGELVHAAPRAAHPVLTERQREILEVARREGYYDYPRRISQSDLAGKIGVTKSTLCQALMIVERKLLAEGRN